MVHSQSGALLYPTNFWSANYSNARTGLGLGSANFQPSSAALTNLASNNGGNLTNLLASNLVGIIPASNIATATLTNISGTLSIVSGGTGATNAAGARSNLGITDIVATAASAGRRVQMWASVSPR